MDAYNIYMPYVTNRHCQGGRHFDISKRRFQCLDDWTVVGQYGTGSVLSTQGKAIAGTTITTIIIIIIIIIIINNHNV